MCNNNCLLIKIEVKHSINRDFDLRTYRPALMHTMNYSV